MTKAKLESINFYALIKKVETTSDGGGKLTLEFGSHDIEAIIKIQRLQSQGDLTLAIAAVPYSESNEV